MIHIGINHPKLWNLLTGKTKFSIDRLRPEIVDWFNESRIEYIFILHLSPVYSIFYDAEIDFKNRSDEILFKLTWL